MAKKDWALTLELAHIVEVETQLNQITNLLCSANKKAKVAKGSGKVQGVK